jgi:CRP-like cAMP-binding protein
MDEQIRSFVLNYTRVSKEELDEVLPHFKYINVRKGDVLVRQHDVCHSLYFINSGLLRMYYKKDDSETTRCLYAENEFGCALKSFVTQTPSTEYVQALEDCSLVVFDFAFVQEISAKYMSWNVFFRKLLEYAYVEVQTRVEHLLFMSAEERYLEFLRTRPHIAQRVPQQYIATYLGITPISLSRIRAKLMAGSKKLITG